MTGEGLAAAFRGRRVLLTGHTGFKGSWLAIWLHRLGAEVSGFSLPPPTEPSLFVEAGVEGLLRRHVVGDVRDGAALDAVLAGSAPEFVFHLAAQSLVRESYREPLATFEVNTLGTARLLDAVRRRAGPCVVVVVTSDKCYENREHVWGYRECDALGGHDPYSASKGAAELVVGAYLRSFFGAADAAGQGIRVASVRAGNVIGGGDWAPDRIVPDAVRALRAGEPVAVRNPASVRPWQHVLEPLSGYLTLAARMSGAADPALAGAWNFGPLPGQDASVAELIELFLREWGSGTWVRAGAAGGAPAHEAEVLRLAVDKAVTRLGWRPRWGLERAVAVTARWYRDWADGGPAGDPGRCVRDIEAYEQGEEA
jgi:CDP-glucose 4,6-dehydratase